MSNLKPFRYTESEKNTLVDIPLTSRAGAGLRVALYNAWGVITFLIIFQSTDVNQRIRDFLFRDYLYIFKDESEFMQVFCCLNNQ